MREAAREWPRAMRRATAARYCDLAESKFLGEVAAGRLPGPIRLGESDQWDRIGIDAALDKLFGAGAWDWRAEQPGLRSGAVSSQI